ncbi:MAG TPA: ATP-binding cassette domain-containing protein, partial [Methanothermobacter thermautotrophicus]|nr:ATP-binding cassette domain-containing protein [Methanothermobacter thermautotrophicus]
MSFIKLENVTKKFKGVEVLRDISVEIDEGKVLGILGRSGAGKSVLINMLRGMKEYRPDSGRVIYNVAICPECLRVEPPSFDGRNCSCGSSFALEEVDFWNCDKKIFAAVRRRIAIMLQRTFALYEDDTVIDNVIKSMPELEYETALYRALELLEMTQMGHRITHIARDLSGGEKQRVVLARQLAKEPMLFLADEPTGTLDPQTAELIHDALIEGVKEKGITMIITSHWPEVMSDLSDYAIWIEKGEIVEEGDPDTVVARFMEQVPAPEKAKEFE